jgi:hypothetical protein
MMHRLKDVSRQLTFADELFQLLKLVFEVDGSDCGIV